MRRRKIWWKSRQNDLKRRKKGKERKGKERKGKERKGRERKGKERKGKEKKRKERKGKERKGKKRPVDEVRWRELFPKYIERVRCATGWREMFPKWSRGKKYGLKRKEK